MMDVRIRCNGCGDVKKNLAENVWCDEEQCPFWDDFFAHYMQNLDGCLP